jgi:hypothetical protein
MESFYLANHNLSMKKGLTRLTTLVYFALLISCSRDYSYEGGLFTPPVRTSAVYIFSSNAGNCIPNKVLGDYYAGSTLNASHVVELQVNVDSTGNYHIVTSSNNGIVFSATGSFTSTGAQTILLKGNGTPTSDGNYTFVTPDSSQCMFTVSVSKAVKQVAKFTLAGAPNTCVSALVDGNYTAGSSLNNLNKVTISVDVIKTGEFTIRTDTLDGISFSTTGIFTQTGVQQVVLAGTGRPQKPRNLVFTPLGDSSTCSFTIAVVNPQPLATYVLESGGGTNTNPCFSTVSGDYIAGTPLASDNTVAIKVYVTAIGNFTVATQNINGIEFLYTGNFTTTGGQNVILQGAGTPIAKGTFHFTPTIVGPTPIGGAACEFSVLFQ